MTKKQDASKIAAAAAAASEAYDRAVEAFSEALKQLHNGAFAEAKAAFESIDNLVEDEPALVERARTYASICDSKLTPPRQTPTSPEDCYHAAVVLSNRGEHDEAVQLLNQALTDKTEAKYLYARASTYALKGNADAAIGDLRQAIAEEPSIRFQAVNDSDFELIREEPAFIDIIEPTPTGA